MKKRSLLKSMLLLCALIAGSGSVWAVEETIASFSASAANGGTLNGWTLNNSPEYSSSNGGFYKLIANNLSIDSPTATWANYSNITITITARKFGGPNSTQGKISVMQGETELTSYSPTSTSLVASSVLSITPAAGALRIICAGASDSKGCGVSSIVIKGEPSTPTAIVSKTSLDFGRVAAGATKNLTFTVTPANLTGNLSITSDNAKYTVTPTSIAMATTTETTITVTAAPTAVGDDMNGTITISGGGLASPKTVDLSCTIKDPSEITYDFSAIDGFSGWSNSYANHSVVYAEATVSFSAAGKQTGTITDIPVQKAGDVIVALNNRGEIMKSVVFTCRQWGTKAQTLRLYASTDGGKTWGDQIGTDQTDFDIESASLPANTNAVKLTTTNSSNQVGIESVSFTIDSEHFNVHITDAGWASISYGKEIDIPAGVTAYYASASTGSSVILKEIEGGYIPANEGIVVSGSKGIYTANVTTTGASLGETNLLKANLAPTVLADTYYTLAVDGGNPIFKKSSGVGTLAAGKAYLDLSGLAPILTVDFGDVTGIGASLVNSEQRTVNSVYDLQGRKVAQPTKGLYIVNGKKIVIK